MATVLTLDVGNSNYTTIVYQENQKIIYNNRHESVRDEHTLKQYYQELKKSIPCEIDMIIISSVIPSMTQALLLYAKNYFNCPVINCDLALSQLQTKLDQPKELGADFIASAIAAKHKYSLPALIIDMGTANKISVIDQDGVLLGGIIQPGLGQMMSSYQAILSHLPNASLRVPDSVIGTNTIDCIQSGVTYGALYGLLGMAKQMEKEINQSCSIILTGGYANLYKPQPNVICDQTLINDGLYYLAKHYLGEKI